MIFKGKPEDEIDPKYLPDEQVHSENHTGEYLNEHYGDYYDEDEKKKN